MSLSFDDANDLVRLRKDYREAVAELSVARKRIDALERAHRDADLGTALGILEFHEGSGAPEFPGAEPTIRINAEDFATVLAAVRAATKSAGSLP